MPEIFSRFRRDRERENGTLAALIADKREAGLTGAVVRAGVSPVTGKRAELRGMAGDGDGVASNSDWREDGRKNRKSD